VGGFDFVDGTEEAVDGRVEALSHSIAGAGGEPLGGSGEAQAECGFDLALEVEGDVEFFFAEGGEHSELAEPGCRGTTVLFPMFGVGKDDGVDKS